jgi:hypothetical protein
MNVRIKEAMEAALSAFGKINNYLTSDFAEKLTGVFDAEKPYLDKVASMDEVFDDEPTFEAFREVFFDLLLINFFTEDVQKLEEDYLESTEWEAIEEETIERGTELLNVLLYLKECDDEDIEPELEDFLKEFLLVDEDEFQDEHRIYEEVIANQTLIDSSLEELAKITQKIPETSELKELFYSILGFFREQHPDKQEFEDYIKYSSNADFDAAVYALLVAYK